MLYLLGCAGFTLVGWIIESYDAYRVKSKPDTTMLLGIMWASLLWPLFAVAIPLALLCVGWMCIFDRLPSLETTSVYLNTVVWPIVDTKIKQGFEKCKETVLAVVEYLKDWFANLMGK